MLRMITYGNEFIHINSQKNFIEISMNSGRTWNVRYNGTSFGDFKELNIEGKDILATTSKGLYCSTNSGGTWNKRN